MQFKLELERPETFPFIIKKFHFEKLAPIFSIIEINMDMKNPMKVIFACKDDFFNWVNVDNHIELVKDDDWKTYISETTKSIMMEFFTATSENDAANKLGQKLAILLKEYCETT